jgi:hypothetical protein
VIGPAPGTVISRRQVTLARGLTQQRTVHALDLGKDGAARRQPRVGHRPQRRAALHETTSPTS